VRKVDLGQELAILAYHEHRRTEDRGRVLVEEGRQR
jgi:hypothetical protein